jgi:hypothetical protein
LLNDQQKNKGLEPTLLNDQLKNAGMEPTLSNDQLKNDGLELTLSNDRFKKMMDWNQRCRMIGKKNEGRIRHCQFIKSFSDDRCPALLPPIAVECTLCILFTVYHESKLLKIYWRLKCRLSAKSCVLPSSNPVGEIDSGYHADV